MKSSSNMNQHHVPGRRGREQQVWLAEKWNGVILVSAWCMRTWKDGSAICGLEFGERMQKWQKMDTQYTQYQPRIMGHLAFGGGGGGALTSEYWPSVENTQTRRKNAQEIALKLNSTSMAWDLTNSGKSLAEADNRVSFQQVFLGEMTSKQVTTRWYKVYMDLSQVMAESTAQWRALVTPHKLLIAWQLTGSRGERFKTRLVNKGQMGRLGL